MAGKAYASGSFDDSCGDPKAEEKPQLAVPTIPPTWAQLFWGKRNDAAAYICGSILYCVEVSCAYS